MLQLKWMAAKVFLKKGWAFCKKYWQLLVGAAIPIIIFLLTRKSTDIKKVLERVNEDHEREIQAINDHHEKVIKAKEDERVAKENADREAQEALRTIARDHQVDLENIDAEKKKKVDALLKNPSEADNITHELARILGVGVNED